jgi:hypothetical protein
MAGSALTLLAKSLPPGVTYSELAIVRRNKGA